MSLALVDFSGRSVAAVPVGGRLVVGRAVECDVTLTDPTISRRHAELRADDGLLLVRDLGSRNGTFRNGQRIEVAQLRPGDSVTFGALTLRIADVAPAAPAGDAAHAPAPVPPPAPRPVAPQPVAPPEMPAPAAPPRAAGGQSDADAAAWFAAALAEQERAQRYAALAAPEPVVRAEPTAVEPSGPDDTSAERVAEASAVEAIDGAGAAVEAPGAPAAEPPVDAEVESGEEAAVGAGPVPEAPVAEGPAAEYPAAEDPAAGDPAAGNAAAAAALEQVDSSVGRSDAADLPSAASEESAADPDLSIVAERGGATPAAELAARKLALLLDVAKGLGGAGEVGALLDRVVAYAFETLDADRAAILLATEDAESGTLRPAVARDRWGGDLTAGGVRQVPRSIARAALERRAALLSVNAALDPRFGGQSVLHQRVRSAMCAPLLGSDGPPLGVLYVDSAAPDRTFDEADLDFLSAFAGIAASALETTRLAERVRLEAVARGNFERYFAPPVAARIARSSEFARPGGERRHVTVLFGDLRGFTGFAAAATPDAVAHTISEYLSAMVECVFRHGGTLDKFIGDAVMAQWGAPEGHPDDPDRAMRAALDMIDALDALHAQWNAEGRPTLAMGIGLSYGEVFAGNIGSERRLEFTVLGDAVNQASRLCDAAGPNEILVSDSLRRVLREPPPMRLLPAPYAPGVGAAGVYAVVRRVS